MTSQSESDASSPLPDDENTSEGRTEKVVGADQPDSEATLAGPDAASETGTAAPSDETPTTALAPDTSVDPEATLEQKIGGILEEFAQTLAPQHQDLNQTLAQTSLKPAFDSNGLNDFDGKPVPPSASVRARSIRPSDQTVADAAGEPSTGPGASEGDLDYVTLNKLGEGGMGTVHLARQVALGREVALKQIHQRSSGKESVRDEFLTEAVLTGKLEHPNIVPIYEVGASSGGELFYSMKNVKGRAWDETIDELTLDENMEILIDVCDAVAFAHAEGVIHRDLKPQNIMTGGFGEVLVLDWGLAVLTHPGEDMKASAGGTPSYMAPEMINPPFLVGPRSDVYLLGAILFRFLTGTVPHAGKSAMSSLQAVSRNEIVTPDADRLEDLDPTGELLNVALKAMATAPADRYQTVGEFQQAVREFESHQESLKLAARAEDALQSAEQSGDYTEYSRSMIGFEEAVTLWAGNESAAEGVQRSRQAYALCAERKEDYELGLSLLDASNAEQREVIARLTAARDERDTRQGRLKRMKQGLVAAAVLMLTVVTGAAFWINQERIEADTQRGIAVTEKKEADRQRNLADENASEALKQKGIAETETASAIASREITEATLARSNHFLAQARWDNNRAADARELLQKVPLQHRNVEWYLARRQFEGSGETLYGHTDRVLSVSFSPDGTRITSGSYDDTIRLWDAATGEELHTLKGHTLPVYSVSFSPDGTRIASGSNDQTIRLWDASTGEELHTLEGHTDIVRSVSFSPDGTRIASGSSDKTIRLWDASTGEQLNTLRGHTGFVNSVSFSPDGTRIVSGSGLNEDPTIRLWDVATGEQLHTLTGHTNVVRSVSFSPDGTRIASGSYDKTIRLWDASTGEELHTLEGHTGPVWSVRFNVDGTSIASGSSDRTIRLWDASTGEEIHTLKGHTDDVASVSFSTDSARLLSQGRGGQKLIWDLKSGAVLPDGNVEEFPAGNDSSKSPDDRWLAVPSGTDVLLVDLAYRKTPREQKRREALASPKPRWHSEQFQEAQSSKQWYAAVFHAAWLLKLNPSDAALHDDLQEAHRQLQAVHNGQSPPLPAVVKEMLKLPRGSDETLKNQRALQKANQLNDSSWQIVKQPELSVEKYQLALDMAAEANTLRPDYGMYLNTLGVAQYRVQEYKEALATLTRSEKLNAPRFGGQSPHDLVFLAMTRFQLGEQQQAADLIQKVKAIAAQAKQKDAELEGFIKEAEFLIRSPAVSEN